MPDEKYEIDKFSYLQVGKVTGATISAYITEHSRITRLSDSAEKNFHIFYWLLHGLKSQNRLEDFNLESEKSYKYLQNEPVTEPDEKMVEKFANLVNAMKFVGFRESDIDEIFKICCKLNCYPHPTRMLKRPPAAFLLATSKKFLFMGNMS